MFVPRDPCQKVGALPQISRVPPQSGGLGRRVFRSTPAHLPRENQFSREERACR